MKRTTAVLVSLLFSLACFADDKPFNLLEVGSTGGKGRIQDVKYRPRDPQLAAILAMGKDAIPLLIDALESETAYERPPLDFWPTMVEGDMALVVLSDLFLDATWSRSTLPELCWDTVLERKSDGETAWDLLDDFVRAHGRAELANRWRQAWAQHASELKWDPKEQFFVVDGRELAACVSVKPASAGR